MKNSTTHITREMRLGADGEFLEPCALCGSQDFKRVATEAGHPIYRCQSCSLVQVRPLPSQTSVSNQSYWRVDLESPAIQKARLGSHRVFSQGLRRLEETTGTSIKGQKILDVGCGMGFFLEIAKAEQAIPFGIDISQEAAQFAMQRAGFHVLTVEGAPIRETWGAKGRLIETVTRMMSAVSGGVLDFQVVIMALARKR